ncbi:hypothetical protein BDV35DRAFT_375069 [Aspergillus flavus]|uniref:Uncharacterized protein n=1 Tax=Aspergillus flavus TaxID=5059 RepID=A0A5N6GHG2_ASPFL|nr:hypothetical protein BDV35DRAFT_375069 [Aspergillus flavus]
MCFLARTKPDRRRLEITPHPLSPNYAIVEFDIPNDHGGSKNGKMPALTLVRHCIEQLRSVWECQNLPALLPHQKYGRIYCRVRTETVHTALRSLENYLKRLRWHLEHRTTHLWDPVQMPFKCRDVTSPTVLLAMRWREGGQKRMCLRSRTICFSESSDSPLKLWGRTYTDEKDAHHCSVEVLVNVMD